MTTTINFERVAELKNIFAQMGSVEISEPIVHCYVYEVLIGKRGSFRGTWDVVRYYAETRKEADNDLAHDMLALKAVGKECYRINLIREIW